MLLDLGRQGKDSPYWDAVRRAARRCWPISARMLASWREHLAQTLPLPALFDRILEDTGYQDYINDGSEEGEQPLGERAGAAPAGL